MGQHDEQNDAGEARERNEPRSPHDVAMRAVIGQGLGAVYGRETPPDLSARILERASEDGRVLEMSSARRGTRFWLERGLVAAGVAGFLTAALFVAQPWADESGSRAGQAKSLNGDSAKLPAGAWAAAQGEWSVSPTGVELSSGWMLVDGMSEPVRRHGELAWVPEGRALLRAGPTPTELELDELITTYSSGGAGVLPPLTEEEQAMIRDPFNWLGGGGLAVCLLAGVGLVNGEAVMAQAVQEKEAEVRVVMGENAKSIQVKTFDTLDANKDGFVDDTELNAETVKALDKDSDGKVSAAEFPAPGIFFVTSEDADGKVTVQGVVAGGAAPKGAGVMKDGVGGAKIKIESELNALRWSRFGGVSRAFTALDSNKDGSLDGGEAGVVLLKHADKDGDSLISRKEWDDVMSTTIPKDAEKSPIRVTFDLLDANGDSKLDAEEFAKVAIEALDASADGVLSFDEFRGAAIRTVRAGLANDLPVLASLFSTRAVAVATKEHFAQFDKNSDSLLDADEQKAFKAEKAIDTDGDGKVSKAEWDAAVDADLGKITILNHNVVAGRYTVNRADSIDDTIKKLEEQIKKAAPEVSDELAARLAEIRKRVAEAVKAADEIKGELEKVREEAVPAAPTPDDSEAGK